MMTSAYIDAIEVLGPGLGSWDALRATFDAPDDYVPDAEIPSGPLHMLGPNERRRTTPAIRLALQVAQQLAEHASVDLARAASVFASSAGDLQVTDNVCCTLPLPGAPVSPTQFHNIVHNAAAGYWSIGAGAHASSTSLSAGDATFAAGLLEALALLHASDDPVLYVCYEQPAPPRLDRYLPICAPFAVAMILGARPFGAHSLALRATFVAETDETRMAHPSLETLRRGNAAARALPMLERVARGSTESALFHHGGGHACLAVNAIPA